MKKIILLLIVVIFLGGFFININYLKKETKPLTVSSNEERSNDLFSNYYSDADKIVNEMTLEEKIGQLFLVRYDDNLVNYYIDNFKVGGFILFAKDFEKESKNSISIKISSFQKRSKEPLAIAVDEEGGFVTRVSKFPAFRDSKFLSPKEYYEIGGYELLESTENEKAKLLKSIGVNLNLAPVADVSTNKDDFIYNRTFGYNALETSYLIENMVNYANNNYFSSCLKHFPGYGNNSDTHTGIAIDDREYTEFTNSDYLPFIKGIEAKVPFILISHNVIKAIDPDYPSSLSYKVITKELRQKLQFSGIVITDDLDMEAVKSYAKDGHAATLAINAGADMIITSDVKNMYNELLASVKNKQIKIDTINQAVKRILAWKIAYQIL